MGTIRIERRPVQTGPFRHAIVWDVIRFVGPHAFYLRTLTSEAEAQRVARGLAIDYGLLSGRP